MDPLGPFRGWSQVISERTGFMAKNERKFPKSKENIQKIDSSPVGSSRSRENTAKIQKRYSKDKTRDFRGI